MSRHEPGGARPRGSTGAAAAAGALGRVRAALLPARSAAERRRLTTRLARAVRARLDGPLGVRELGAALCAEMSARRGGRPVELRFERFPDEIEVTGLWMEFPGFDLVIVEERAAPVQQLVILGHELWHLHAGHSHHRVPGADAAAFALSGGPGWPGSALTVAARNGSHASAEQEAEDFGHRLATALRPWVDTGHGDAAGPAPGRAAPGGAADRAESVRQALQASLGYRGPRG
ncbi:toxin-antitoxin system, toxin component [Streptomyces sp. HM190]|uniref:toxin-antitoxin system, toxin component n=1 Tax=Streptomyces sp. HM190 TaxID=2695266 RepID=UPI001F2C5B8E|nr:toxin-antitoxin system, toxin component [Streptomyces sp. HM190]